MIKTQENDNCGLPNDLQFYMQFCIRLIVLILSGLSSTLIILTCIITKSKDKSPHWNIILIIAQSGAELIATIFALSLTYNSISHQDICGVFGYIRFSSWLTSLLISYAMVQILYFGNTNEKKYQKAKKYILYIILVCYLIPYLWLLAPQLQGDMGPTGWMSFKQKQPFYIFCGFKIFDCHSNVAQSAKWWYTLYFTFPLGITALFSFLLSKKNTAKVNDELMLNYDPEFEGKEFEQKIMIFPKIYFLAWVSYFCVRYIDLCKIEIFYTYLPLYIIYSFIYLAFDLHICYACYQFHTIYEEFLQIKQCWKEKKQLLCNYLYRHLCLCICLQPSKNQSVQIAEVSNSETNQ